MRSRSASSSAARATRRLGGLDQRAHDVRLQSVVEVAAEARVRLRAAVVGHPRGHDRLAVRRWRGDLRDGQVAVDGERERARDGRRRHVQDVRAPALCDRGALADTEAVLLVDHGDGEVAEGHVALDESVRADGDLHVARGDQLTDVRVLPLGEPAREERDPHPELGQDPLDGEEVLLGEGLGRRHQRALAAGLHRAQQRVDGDGGLAGADVALQQPLHRRGARQIGVDLCDRLLLRGGERERQRVAVAVDEVARRWQRLRDERLSLRCASAERELEREQLVEGEPLPAELRLVERARADARRRARPRRSGSRCDDPQAGREQVAAGARRRESRLADRAQLLLGEVLGGRVDRREVGRVRRVAEVVRLDREAVAVLSAAQAGARRPVSASPRATAG